MRGRRLEPILQAPAFNAILNPLHLRDLSSLVAGSPLRHPQRHWTSTASRKLDAKLRHTKMTADERIEAQCVMGIHASFAAKSEVFFNDASEDLAWFARKGVSPNVFGSAMVFVAWNWEWEQLSRLHIILSSPYRAAAWWHALSEARIALEKLRPLALAVGRRRQRQATRRSGRHNTSQAHGDATGCADILWQVNEAHALLGALRGTLPKAWRQHRTIAGPGRPPNVKVNGLIRCLAAVAKARTGNPRFERLARILRAGDLPPTRNAHFDRDAVRKRYHDLDRTLFASELGALVERSYREATKAMRR